jgi:hypothetical protein
VFDKDVDLLYYSIWIQCACVEKGECERGMERMGARRAPSVYDQGKVRKEICELEEREIVKLGEVFVWQWGTI